MIYAHFPLELGAYLRYKTSIDLPRWSTAWRRHGFTVCARQSRLAIALWPGGLGAHPTRGPSLCAHAPLRTDPAPRASRRVGCAPQGRLHDLPSAPVIPLALQEAAPAYH